MKRKWLYLIPILSTVTFLLLTLYDPFVIGDRIEALTLDYRFYIRNLIAKPEVSEDILIVSVDEQSIRQFGRWPWSRRLQARLIELLLEGGPKALAVGIFYSEPEKDKMADVALLEAIKKGTGRLILAATFEVEKGKKGGEAPDFLFNSAFLKVKDLNKLSPPDAYRILLLPQFGEKARVGHVYSQPDRDGKIRWECLYVRYGDELYPSLALITSAIAMGKSIEDMTVYGGGGVSIDKVFIPTDIHGRILVNYRGKEKSYTYISASDVLNGNVTNRRFRDKIVFLGTSAIGTYDTEVTSFSANMPGAEKNATVLDNILKRDFLREAQKPINVLVVIITGLFLGSVLPRMRAFKGAIISASFILVESLTTQALFTYSLLHLNFIYPIANTFFISITIPLSKYFIEEKKAKQLRQMFSNYVSPKIVAELISNPEKARLGGERRTVTVIFMDIVGFSALSERMQPEEVVSILNEFFKEMTDLIFRWDGTLDKFVGDQIMAFWGAPVQQPNHAELAMRFALHASKKLNELRERWKSEGKPVLDCGMGLNTGVVLVGNIGAENKKMDYTIIGDHVNIAARVEKLTRQYDARILITENVLTYIKDYIELNKIGHFKLIDVATVKVKGKEEELRIYRIEDSEEDLPEPYNC